MRDGGGEFTKFYTGCVHLFDCVCDCISVTNCFKLNCNQTLPSGNTTDLVLV